MKTCPRCLRTILYSEQDSVHTCTPTDYARGLEAENAALKARVEELEANQQYTCEAHHNEVKKGGACCWCQLAAQYESPKLNPTRTIKLRVTKGEKIKPMVHEG